jgi:hypothetical protein
MKLIGIVLVILAAVACTSADIDSVPQTSSVPPASPAATTPAATAGPEPATFRGHVTRVERACELDGRCSIDVAVNEALGGFGPLEGATVTVIEAYGLSAIRCYGRWDSNIAIGDEVLVSGEWSGYPELSICPSADYLVERLGPTPVPTPCATLISPSAATPTLVPCTSNEPTVVPPTATP